MKVNIFREIKLGKEIFIPKHYDENSFVMDWIMQAGGKVPTHFHNYCDEHFIINKGEILFTINGQKITKKQGQELTIPKGTPHAITNTSNDKVQVTVSYSPCADTHRLFEILVQLDEKNEGNPVNMIKYFYLAPRLGLREFSTPSPAFILTILKTLSSLMGKLLGWHKLIDKFKM
jgi:quercetin dioxygenase-like cupin family protein